MNRLWRLVLSLAAVSLMAAMPLAAQAPHERPRLDPDDAYKNNCMRCHVAMRQYGPGTTQTVLTHMHVRADLTDEEADAILEYLIGGPESAEQTRLQPSAATRPPAAQEPPVAPEPQAAQKPPAPAAQEPTVVQKPPAAEEPPAPAIVQGAAPSAGAAAGPLIEAGLAAFKKRQFAEAQTEFRKAAEADPTSTAAHFYLGYTEGMMSMGSRGSRPSATEEPPLPATVQTATPSPAAKPFTEAGLAALKKRQFADAEAEFRKAVQADSKSTVAQFYLGYTEGVMSTRRR